MEYLKPPDNGQCRGFRNKATSREHSSSARFRGCGASDISEINPLHGYGFTTLPRQLLRNADAPATWPIGADVNGNAVVVRSTWLVYVAGSVAEADSEVATGLQGIAIERHRLHATGDLGEWHIDHVWMGQGHHHP